MTKNHQKSAIKRCWNIHTNKVKDYLDEREPNKVLDEKPSEISTKETLLPRRTRRTLAQLRSGYSPYLNSYEKRIGTADYDWCLNCNIEPHTTRHLFNCKKKKTTLTTIPLGSPNRSCELPRNNRLQRGHSLTEGSNNNNGKTDHVPNEDFVQLCFTALKITRFENWWKVRNRKEFIFKLWISELLNNAIY